MVLMILETSAILALVVAPWKPAWSFAMWFVLRSTSKIDTVGWRGAQKFIWLILLLRIFPLRADAISDKACRDAYLTHQHRLKEFSGVMSLDLNWDILVFA